MINRIENAIPPMFLEFLKTQVQNQERWSFIYPKTSIFEKKYPRLTIYDGSNISETKFLEGVSYMILLMIYHKMLHDGNNFFKPNMLWCGVAIKDKLTPDNLHIDHDDDIPEGMKVVKLLGLLHAEWPEEYGGHFYHGGEEHIMNPGTFLCFDPLVKHKATTIHTDVKRIAIDFTVLA